MSLDERGAPLARRTTAVWIGLLAWLGTACTSTGPATDEPVDGATDYWLYVAAESADEVYKVRFDGERAEVAGIVPVGYQPTEIEGPHGLAVSPDGAHWFVSIAHGKPFGLLYKYDAATDELVGEVELGLFPATMQISEATGLLYCVNFDLHGDMSPSSVSIVDPDAMVEIARTVTGPMPHGSRISPDGLFHYSCSMMADTLFEIDTVDFEIERRLALAAEPGAAPPEPMGAMTESDDATGGGMQEASAMGMGGTGGMSSGMHGAGPRAKPTWVHPHPTLPRAYVCLNGAAQVVEVDLERWEVTRRFATGKGPYNVEVTPDGSKLLVSYKSEGAIGVWDVEAGIELARIPSSRRVTHGVAISRDGRFGFVSSEGIGSESGTVDVIDMETNALVATVEVGLQAGGIAFWKEAPRRAATPERPKAPALRITP